MRLKFFKSPNNNIYYLLVGYSGSAILYMAKNLTNNANLNRLNLNSFATDKGKQQINNIELVYKVASIERTDILSDMIYRGAVNSAVIWQKEN